jgi:hypothetical protein
MKKIGIIIFALLGFNLFSLDIRPIMGFRMGYNLYYEGSLRENEVLLQYDHSDSLSIQLTTGIRIEGLRIIGIYENTMMQVRLDNYNPIQDDFTVKISYSFFDFEIGFSNSCNHTVKTQTDIRKIYSNSGRRMFYLSYYKEF